jgi:thioredoxin reductase (NADPH)
VHFFVPGKEINVSQEEMAMLKESENLVLHLGSVVKEIFGEGKVEGLKFVERGNADSEQSLPVVGVFVYLQGGKPITDFLQGQLPTSEEGCLQVDREFQTSIAGVYAIGDVICTHVKQAVIAAGDGAVAAIAAEKWLRGRSRTRVDWGK